MRSVRAGFLFGRVRSFALSALCFYASTIAFSQNLVSRPVGFLRVSVPSNAQVLAAQPFISGVETNGGPILKWDATSGYTSSTAVAEPGEGFWLVNEQSSNRNVYLMGEVVLSPSNTALLYPGLNLVGYPYSSALPLNQSALGCLTNSVEILNADATVPAPDESVMGKGYWVKALSEDCIVWTEVRPYENAFPASGLPEITDITTKDGLSVVLLIACEGDESLDVFYQDISPTNHFDPVRNWQIAEARLPANGQISIEWGDAGSDDRAAPGEILGRYYLVGRTDIDVDGDGIPDARERFVNGEELPTISGVPSALVTHFSSTTGAALTVLSSTGDDATAWRSTNSEPIQALSVGRIIYVDQRIGDDTFSGRQPVAATHDGPKKTIRAGFGETTEGGRMVIRSGTYTENLDLVGRDVQVNIDGHVVLAEPPRIELPRDAMPVGSSTNR